jgi:type IV pilus assembly protein PilN
MRLDINLASHPYEDARQFWMRWGTAAGALGLLTLILLALDITGWVDARRDRVAINQARAMIARRDAVRANAEQILNLAKNRTTRDQSQFLNQLIERKSFSWTQVLESLEKVMPPRVHLVSISPALDEDNQLVLKMMVAGDSRDRAVELVRRMEDSRRFAQTYIVREAHMESQTGDSEQVEIAAVYVPEEPPAEGGLEATTPAKSGRAPKSAPKQPSPKSQTQVARRIKP